MSKDFGKDRSKKANTVEVLELPKCDFCNSTANYDGKTVGGGWANMCDTHFHKLGVGLGLGRGQKLVLKGVDHFGV